MEWLFSDIQQYCGGAAKPWYEKMLETRMTLEIQHFQSLKLVEISFALGLGAISHGNMFRGSETLQTTPATHNG